MRRKGGLRVGERHLCHGLHRRVQGREGIGVRATAAHVTSSTADAKTLSFAWDLFITNPATAGRANHCAGGCCYERGSLRGFHVSLITNTKRDIVAKLLPKEACFNSTLVFSTHDALGFCMKNTEARFGILTCACYILSSKGVSFLKFPGIFPVFCCSSQHHSRVFRFAYI